jgi:hypothetical protein
VSAVVYTAAINGRVKRIHALAMKPMRNDYSYFTPFVDPSEGVVLEERLQPEDDDVQYIPNVDVGGIAIQQSKRQAKKAAKAARKAQIAAPVAEQNQQPAVTQNVDLQHQHLDSGDSNKV